MVSYAEESVDYLLEAFSNVEVYYNDLHEELKKCDLETTDLLHELELSPKMNLWQGFYIAKQLRLVKIKKRRLLNEKDELFYLHQWVTDNPQFKNALIRVKNQIKQRQRNVERKIYTPRVLGDLPTISKVCHHEVKEVAE